MKRFVAEGAVSWVARQSLVDRQFLPRRSNVNANYAFVLGGLDEQGFDYVVDIRDISTTRIETGRDELFIALRPPAFNLSMRAALIKKWGKDNIEDDPAHNDYRDRFLAMALRPVAVSNNLRKGYVALLGMKTSLDKQDYILAGRGRTCLVETRDTADGVDVEVEVRGGARQESRKNRISLTSTFVI